MRTIKNVTVGVVAIMALSTAGLGCFKPSIKNGGYSCSPDDHPACPDGFTCVKGSCINTPGAIASSGDMGATWFNKTATYTGNHVDLPILGDATMCPDRQTADGKGLEPNDSARTAFPIDAPPDTI